MSSIYGNCKYLALSAALGLGMVGFTASAQAHEYS
jgi:hypothetical protein